jgi:hypothetical protein
MLRVCAIATCLVLGAVGTSSANPLDSPGTVYIDGLPCNLACQSYMAWSNKVLEKHRVVPSEAQNVSAGRAPNEAVRKRLSKRIMPSSVDATPMKTETGLQPAFAAKQGPASPTAAIAEPPSKGEPEVRIIQRTPQEQIMAALGVAEQITTAEMPKPKAVSDEASDANTSPSGDAKAGNLVALLISRADTKSVSALNGANVAIDVAQSGAENDIRTSLAAAGATGVQLTTGDAKPVDRLIRGEVPAAVLGLVSSDAAEAFPEVKGFKVLRVPLAH